MSATAWDNFLVASAGAAAALTGLVFVAVSINVQRILASPSLPARAAETLMIFMAVLVIAICGLVPGQGTAWLGAEIGATSLFAWTAAGHRHLNAYRHPNLEPLARRWLWVRVLAAQAATVPFMIAGLLLLMGRQSAMMWVAPGTVGSFISGAFNAWVLLFEIQRQLPHTSPPSGPNSTGRPPFE
jgi:modulator of FtsH protease